MAECNQVNTPTVNTDPLPCGEFIQEACVIIDEAVPFLGTGENETLKNFLVKLVDKIKEQQYKIVNLTNEVNNLVNP